MALPLDRRLRSILGSCHLSDFLWNRSPDSLHRLLAAQWKKMGGVARRLDALFHFLSPHGIGKCIIRVCGFSNGGFLSRRSRLPPPVPAGGSIFKRDSIFLSRRHTALDETGGIDPLAMLDGAGGLPLHAEAKLFCGATRAVAGNDPLGRLEYRVKNTQNSTQHRFPSIYVSYSAGKSQPHWPDSARNGT